MTTTMRVVTDEATKMADIEVRYIEHEDEDAVRKGHTLVMHHEAGTIQVWFQDGLYQYEDDCNGYRVTYVTWDDLITALEEG